MAENKVICNLSKCCDAPNCGAAVPHNEQDCEPCPRFPDAKCISVDWEEKKRLFLEKTPAYLAVRYKFGSDLVLIQSRWFKMYEDDNGKVLMDALE